MVQRKSFDLYLARTAGMLSGARRVAAVLLVMMLTTMTAWASTFSGGDGSSGNPYQIANTADLNQLAADVNGGNTYYYVYFVLTADIAYTYTKAWNDATSTENNYTAIGDNSHYFNGKFDGQGHTISGIRIYKGGNSNADDYQGLFGRIGSGAEVKNVILADTRITGCDDTGGIVGYNDRGKVTNCHVTSDVTIHAAIGASSHGGIAGRNIGTGAATITGCTSAAALTTATGYNSGYVGGITGDNSGGIVTNCLYLGTTLEGYSRAGAIVGDNSGTVEKCYFTSTTIQGKDNNHNALDNANSAVGCNADGGTVTNCGLTDTPWTGSGTSANDPYMIYTKDQLDLLAQRVNAGNNYKNKFFKLGANITYNKSTENNFTPIGKINYGFYGTFDGQGYTISGININSGSAEKGIFGYVDGTVKNLVVSNCSIVGFARVGAIAGYLRNGTIENCHVSDDVTLSGDLYVGGIAGVSEGGTIKGCTCAATITGTYLASNAEKLGGVVGATVTSSSSSTLTDNIFTGTITTDNLNEYIGAIVGQNDNGTLTNNYHTVLGNGIGGIGAAGSATGADGAGARFARATTTKPADFVEVTTTYGSGTYVGIKAYGTNGLEYNGQYYTYKLILEDHGAVTNYNADLISSNGGRTLDVVLNGRTLYKDGDWNTLCLPFDLNISDPDGPLYGATYRTVTDASISGTTLNITFAEKRYDSWPDNTLMAGRPYIIKWDKANDYVDDDAHNIVNPVFASVVVQYVGGDYENDDQSVRFLHTYDAITGFTALKNDGYDVLLMGGNNTLRYAGDGASIGAFRAFFAVKQASAGSAQLTSFNIDFGDGETTEIKTTNFTNSDDAWYTLDGRKLSTQPMQKGVYINNGKKVIIK